MERSEEPRVKPVEKVETFGIFRGIVERFAEPSLENTRPRHSVGRRVTWMERYLASFYGQ